MSDKTMTLIELLEREFDLELSIMAAMHPDLDYKGLLLHSKLEFADILINVVDRLHDFHLWNYNNGERQHANNIAQMAGARKWRD